MEVREARVPLIREEAPAKHVERPTERPSRSEESLPRSATVLTSLIAGAMAGALAKSAIAPLDRTKINFQTSHIPYSVEAALQFMRGVVARAGWRGLWRGNSATMARIVPYAAAQFTAHEQLKGALDVHTPQKAQAHPVRLLLAGSLAGVFSQSLTYPLDLARARLAVTEPTRYSSLSSLFSELWKSEGGANFYRGYTATILGVIPYAGVSFFTYDTLKRKYTEITGAPPSGLWPVVLGGAGGALGQATSYPLDIIRRRMQTTTGGNMRFVAKHVYRTEGLRGFFKGLSMNWVKGPIAVGISFATYDHIRTVLRELAGKYYS